ncbi:MAG: response regulator [Spirochaetia bacterium]|nr:response regulator [Spirochaetia bacterium]
MKKVLIVDDTKFMRSILASILKKKDLKIVGEAVNGRDAIEKYKELQPDLVTMDIIMPEMDGIQAVREILKIDPNAKVLMCSAMGQQALVIEAIQAGARDFVIKPFQPTRVLEAVDRAFQE